MNKKILIIISIMAVFALALVSLVINSLNQNKKPPTTQETKISALQNSLPGKTSEEEVKQLANIQKVTELTDGSKRYDLKSINPFLPSQIITKDEKVVFEKNIIPSDPGSANRLTLPEVKKIHGEPDIIILGTQDYGEFNNTYSYASKGFVIIASPATGDVFETQVFAPMPTDEYIKRFNIKISNQEAGEEDI